MFMNTRTEREREKERGGRTLVHGGNFIRIPFWEISVEVRGRCKRYKKRYQKKSSLKGKNDKYKNVFRSSEYINSKYVYEYKNRKRKEWKRKRDVLYAMSVTLFVSHFERSLLNTEAPANTIKRDIKRRVHKKGKTISIKMCSKFRIY